MEVRSRLEAALRRCSGANLRRAPEAAVRRTQLLPCDHAAGGLRRRRAAASVGRSPSPNALRSSALGATRSDPTETSLGSSSTQYRKRAGQRHGVLPPSCTKRPRPRPSCFVVLSHCSITMAGVGAKCEGTELWIDWLKWRRSRPWLIKVRSLTPQGASVFRNRQFRSTFLRWKRDWEHAC